MKTYWPLPAILISFFISSTLWGQIEFSGHVDRRYYLPYEPILLKIEIKNNTGNSLSFDTWEDGFISCDITDEHDNMVAPLERRLEFPEGRPQNGDTRFQGRINVARGLKLPVGTKQVAQIQLNSFYHLATPGHYRLRVRFSHRRLGQDWRSAVIPFTVKSGEPLLSRSVGIPSANDDEILSRTVSILGFRAETKQLYCLKIEDEQHVYALVRLSPRAGGKLPDFETDARSQIHILVHTQPKVFTLWIYDINGQLKQQSDYRALPTSQPKLYRDPDIGRVMVLGGQLMVPGQDTDLELPSYKGLQ